ncbi:unnamed protein product, partial [Phaeothamnion confervicola]
MLRRRDVLPCKAARAVRGLTAGTNATDTAMPSAAAALHGLHPDTEGARPLDGWDELGLFRMGQNRDRRKEAPPPPLPPLPPEEEEAAAHKAAELLARGDFDAAADLMRLGRLRTTEPLKGAWTAAIGHKCAHVPSNRALPLLDLLKTVGVEPHRRVYTQAIRACEADRTGDGPMRAVELLREMRDAGGAAAPNAASYAAVLAV